MPKFLTPANRKRIYDTLALVLSALVVWGVITADEAAQYTDAIDKLLAIGGLLLARFNVSPEPEE